MGYWNDSCCRDLTGVGRVLLRDDTVKNIRENIVLPDVKEGNDLLTNESIPKETPLASTTTTPSGGGDLLSFSEMNEIEGISPYITSNEDFYRMIQPFVYPQLNHRIGLSE